MPDTTTAKIAAPKIKGTSVPTGRQTRPPGFNPNPGGGISVIPRRGWTTPSGDCDAPFATRAALLAFAGRNPWLLSEALADADPTMAKAQMNALAACASPGTVALEGYKDLANTGADSRDDAATAEIHDLLLALGPEVGGIDGLRVKGTMALLHYGLWCFEAILGPRGTGIVGIGFVDPLTIEFDRDAAGYLRVYQKQANAKDGRRELNQNTFFWHAHHASVSNPYGRAVFAAGVIETLRAMAFDQELSDGVHNIAIARYVYKYSLETLWRIAVSPQEQGGMELPLSAQRESDGSTYNPAKEWVDAQIAEVGRYLAEKNPDDNFVADASGGVDVLQAGSFSGMEPVLDHKDFRQIRGLDELATTMGRPNSGAQTYTTAEFGLKALGWEALRADVMAPIVAMLNLHFAARGQVIIVKPEFVPIRRSDAVQEANADSTTDATNWNRYLRGAITFEDYCILATGSGAPVDETPEQKAARDEARKLAKPAASDNSDDKKADLPQNGTTKEERDANK